ncbi:MAG: hypothetical protein FD180_1775 [Planctomycetota bacterium]|nr:MAG: hypothetical protein FD180_1775 [Planctomycetota bacterium]
MRLKFWQGLSLAAAAIVAGCSDKPQAPPPDDRSIETSDEKWENNPVRSDGDAFDVSVSVPVQDTIANAKEDAKDECFRKAVDQATKDYLRDTDKYRSNQKEIDRQILQQPAKYVKSHSELRHMVFQRGQMYGLELRVVIDDQRIKNVLQDLGTIRTEIAEKKAILAIYGGKNADKELVGDLGRQLAEYYNKQGYNAVLWDEIAADIAEERNVGEKATEAFIQKFVENPEFAGDQEYQGTLTALRSRGSLVIGFNVIKVSVVNGTVNAGVKAFAKDMVSGRVFANHQEYGNRRMARDSDRDLAMSESLYEAAKLCSAKVVKETNDWFDKSEQLQKGTEYTFKFSGFSEDDIQLLNKQWSATFSTGGDFHMEGTAYVRTYKSEMKGNELVQKVDMMIKKAGLKAKPPMPDSRATTFEFKRQ